MAHLLTWFRDEGVSPDGLFAAWTQNAAVRGLSWDLMISAVVLTLWILAEVAVRRNCWALLAIPATFCIGLSCGLPLYLWFRSRPV
ncbi:K+-transporting ATPase, A chain [Salipiger aestuarii]|nr:K+-transporting ATPase, A chain [Salipiger aestuarii]KAA8614216.1 K+-transporting ATPase, A chain [Salipiger aestuarii]KAB2540855.1 K+-transporting ATPase, A chain [Salipiger aestuarii]